MHELTLFPNVRYIGGVDGRGLDLWVGRPTRFIRVSLNLYGCLNLERVVAYGRRPGSDKLDNLAFQAPATMSSVLNDDEALFGAHRGTNGRANGYDYFATKTEDNPWWCVDLGEVCQLDTLHLVNVLHAAPHQADTLRIEFSQDGEVWELFYDRSAPEVLQGLVSKQLAALRSAAALPGDTQAQRNARAEILAMADTLDMLSKQSSCPSKVIAPALAARLLDLVEMFLPKTLELRAPVVVNTQLLAGLRKVRLSGNDLPACPPQLTLTPLTPGSNQVVVGCEADVREPLAALVVTPGVELWRYNNLRLEAECENGETVVLYDHGALVRLCGQLAWVAYLMGDFTPRSFVLQSVPKLMLRDADGLREAYLWARTRLHGRPKDYRLEVLARFEAATAYDTPAFRLAFGRHAFATPHRYRDKKAYAEAIRELLTWLDGQGVRTMALYGTLLGAVREGTLIDHDDDVDVGFICEGRTEQAFQAAKARLKSLLAATGWEISDDTRENPYATFTVMVPGQAGELFPVELFPLGLHADTGDCTAYMQCMELHTIPAAVIGAENSTVTLAGVDIPAPAHPEAFLAARYGEDWRVPNPLFEI